MKNKIKISSKCQVCNGKGVVPSDETFSIGGQVRIFHTTCDSCNGRGKETRWVNESDVTRVLSGFKKAIVEINA
jgi:DnaJ-class molecular chaperone